MRNLREQIEKIRESADAIERELRHSTSTSEYSREDMLQTAFLAVRMYAETHPRPSHVTQAQAAEMIGKSVATVRKLLHAGIIKYDKTGQIPITEIDRALTAT